MGVKVAQTLVCDSLAIVLTIEKEHRLKSMLREEQSAPLDEKKARSPFYSARPQANASIGLSYRRRLLLACALPAPALGNLIS